MLSAYLHPDYITVISGTALLLAAAFSGLLATKRARATKVASPWTFKSEPNPPIPKPKPIAPPKPAPEPFRQPVDGARNNEASKVLSTPDPAPEPSTPMPPDPDELDRTSEQLETNITTSSQPRDPVQFTVYAPPVARVGTTFVIKVSMNVQPKEDTSSQNAGFENYATIVAEAEKGKPISISIVSDALLIHAPFQQFVWKGHDLIAHFIAYAREMPPDKGPARAALVIVIDGNPVGCIDFSIKISRSLAFSWLPRRQKTQSFDLASVPMGDRARQYNVYYLSHTSDDSEAVTHIRAGLKVAKKDAKLSHLDNVLSEKWKEQSRKQIEASDALVLCWSKSAAHKGNGTPGVEFEWRHAQTVRKKRPGFDIIPVYVGLTRDPPLPADLQDEWAADPGLLVRAEWVLRHVPQDQIDAALAAAKRARELKFNAL